MTVSAPAPPETAAKHDPHPGLSRERALALYRTMLLSRRLDDREILLKRQQKIYFQVSGAGHEAIQTAAAECLRPGVDWIYPYYRDRALCLGLGVSPRDMLLQAVGAADDPASGGRQMPSHWSDPARHIVSSSSPTGSQYLQAVGCAEATRYYQRHGKKIAAWLAKNPAPKPAQWSEDEITLVTGGEGSTSEGEFWEAVAHACLEKLPLVFLIEDNGYAISVPVEEQTAGGNIAQLLAGFPALLRLECDGCDLWAAHAAMEEATAYARAGHGPALVLAHVIRPYSHSLSDDERLYRPDAERAADAERDPLPVNREKLLALGITTETGLKALDQAVEAEILEATEAALAAEPARPENLHRHVYSDAVDLCGAQFASPPKPSGEPKTMVELINACLMEEMRRDPRLNVLGEDVADVGRTQYLGKVKGKGGVFKTTIGLQKAFGDRVKNSPIAEASIVGRSTGMATRGLRPAAEIQFFDYIWPAMMQIRNELAVLRWRSNGGFAAPVVIRCPIGGYLTGGSIYHSQSGEAIFTHIPGLRVAMPSNALDACGLLRTALRGDDPVLFLEHKRLYREPFNRSPHPGLDYCIPFGQARVVKEGCDLTVITYGAVVQRALQAAQRIEREAGRQVEILDLRTLSPYDWPAIAQSVKKTARALVAHEDTLSWGYGAEIAARIGEELFEDLDAPVRRVAAQDLYCAYQPLLEDAILPQSEDLYRAIVEILQY